MLFDFRIRPPFKSFFTTGGMFGGHDGSHDPRLYRPLRNRQRPIPSADKGDMELFFQEMEATASIRPDHRRNCGPNGFVDNATSASSSRKIRIAFSALRALIPMRRTPWLK